MESIRTGFSALTVGERRNYQVSPVFSEKQIWRNKPDFIKEQEGFNTVELRRSEGFREQKLQQEGYKNIKPRGSEGAREQNKQEGISFKELRQREELAFMELRQQEDFVNMELKNEEGFTSIELRRFGSQNNRSTPGAPVQNPYNERVRSKLKRLEEKNQSSDSCYSRSDNSSIHSDPPRVPVHPPTHQQYDTTSLSSLDTASSIDLWNVRAMPNVRITRLDRPIYLRPNPTLRPRPNVFDTLTDELVVKVLSFLTTKDLMFAARVSRRFYFLTWEPDLWRSICLTGENRNVDRSLSSIFQIISKNGVNIASTVKNIVLNGCSRLTDRGLALIARRCRALGQLHLQLCTEITNGGLLDLTSRCEELDHLDVSGCLLVSGVGVPLPISPSSSSPRLPLTYLDMSDCLRLDDLSLRLVVESCPQLQFLFLRRCSLITDVGIKSVSSYCLLLRELSVSDCIKLTDVSLSELGRLGPALRYLSLAKCELISDNGVRNLARHCYRLRYLNLRGCGLVSDSSIEWLSRSCTRLRSLDIGKCNISDGGLHSLSENCPNLKKLSVKGCTQVTDRGVATLSYYCRGLQQLNIQDVGGVTIQGCRVVRGNCRRCIIEHTNPALSL